MGDLWYLAFAYGLVWLGLFGYVVHLLRRAQDLGHEVRTLRDVLRTEGEESPPWDEETASDESFLREELTAPGGD